MTEIRWGGMTNWQFDSQFCVLILVCLCTCKSWLFMFPLTSWEFFLLCMCGLIQYDLHVGLPLDISPDIGVSYLRIHWKIWLRSKASLRTQLVSFLLLFTNMSLQNSSLLDWFFDFSCSSTKKLFRPLILFEVILTLCSTYFFFHGYLFMKAKIFQKANQSTKKSNNRCSNHATSK